MIIITGNRGQLASAITNKLDKLKIEYKGVGRDFDLTTNALHDYILEEKPNMVIHTGAYTQVDKAEEEANLCKEVNAKATKKIALACKEVGAKMMYISTDYVFSGAGSEPFDIDDNKSPLSVYGKTKLQGENFVSEILDEHFIVRISWVFGENREHNSSNFVKTMLRLLSEREEINVVADQIGSPTYTNDLAVLICEMIQTDKYGIYHATNEGFCSWYDFAVKIKELANLNCKINPIKSSEYKTLAKRPLNSRLSKESLDKSGFNRLPTWENALERYLEELGGLS